jgi:hypothetical protein
LLALTDDHPLLLLEAHISKQFITTLKTKGVEGAECNSLQTLLLNHQPCLSMAYSAFTEEVLAAKFQEDNSHIRTE